METRNLELLSNEGKFPIYIYYDTIRRNFSYSTEKRPEAVGSYWKNPFARPKPVVETAETLSDEEIAKKYKLSLSDVKRIKKIIMDKACVEEDEVIPEAQFTNHLGMDSLDFTETVMTFESEFAIPIPDDEAEKVSTVAEAYQLIANKLAEKKQ